MSGLSHFTVTFVCLSLTFTLTSSYRILLLPTPFQSHLNYFIPFGEGLVEGGHEAYMVLSSGSKGIEKIKAKGIKTLLYRPPDGVCQLATDEFHRAVSDAMLDKPDIGRLASIVAPAVSKECDNLLLDDSILKTALDLRFQLVVVDGLFFARCLYLFPVRLGVPFVTLTTFQEIWPARIPALPSHVPFHYSSFSDEMTLYERAINTVMNVVWIVKSRRSPALSSAVQVKYRDVLTNANFDHLIYQSQLWFFNGDIALDYPKPTMPNVVHIGGMSTRPGSPLVPKLQKFMDAATEGVVVVSFGSVIHDIPLEINQKLVSVFRQLPWKVLWRNKDAESLDLPENVLAMKWLPQNDLLAHNNTVAFVTHCGNNGQFEALYHQVPMVGFPIFADQPYNARRMEVKGYGKSLVLKTFTPDMLLEAIKTVALNKSYRDNLRRGSRVFRNQPQTAKQRAVFWVEHIIEHGANHLRSSALDLAWYEYLLLDVLLLLVLSLTVFVILLYIVTKPLIHNLLSFLLGNKKDKLL